jgi:hypothetical protein
MRFDWPATKRIVSRHFTLLLLLWWGGLNCLTGCLTTPAGAATEEHCPMGGEGGDCCLSQSAKDRLSSKVAGTPSNPSQHFDCCSLQSLSADVKRNAQTTTAATATTTSVRVNSPLVTFPRLKFTAPWMRLPDRGGGAHVLHCVFLI